MGYHIEYRYPGNHTYGGCVCGSLGTKWHDWHYAFWGAVNQYASEADALAQVEVLRAQGRGWAVVEYRVVKE